MSFDDAIPHLLLDSDTEFADANVVVYSDRSLLIRCVDMLCVDMLCFGFPGRAVLSVLLSVR